MAEPTLEELHAENARLRLENQQLRSENCELRRRIARLESQVKRLEGQIRRLQGLLNRFQRAEKRQAAPFSKGQPKAEPEKPGRKPGEQYGRKAYRAVPPLEAIDETYDVPLPSACDCGGPIEETGVVDQFQCDIPRRPIWRRFHIHQGRCVSCGRPHQGRHPLQTSDAVGSAASQLGPEVQAGIVILNKRLGLSCGKVVLCLQSLLGISLTRGAVAQILLRAARRCEPQAVAIQQNIRGSPVVRADETGWRIGGRSAWLHTLVGDQATCYIVDPARGAAVPAQVLGSNYPGVILHDGWTAYGRFRAAVHQQCLSHAMRRAHKILETATGGAVLFPRKLLDIFQRSLGWRELYKDGEATLEEIRLAAWKLTCELQNLVSTPKSNKTNETFAKHLRRHLDEWFQFLVFPGVEATNYRAEQALRFPIVNRKVWGGNRTAKGAHAQSTLTSVIQTCYQKALDPMQFLSQTICGWPISLFTPPLR